MQFKCPGLTSPPVHDWLMCLVNNDVSVLVLKLLIKQWIFVIFFNLRELKEVIVMPIKFD